MNDDMSYYFPVQPTIVTTIINPSSTSIINLVPTIDIDISPISEVLDMNLDSAKQVSVCDLVSPSSYSESASSAVSVRRVPARQKCPTSLHTHRTSRLS